MTIRIYKWTSMRSSLTATEIGSPIITVNKPHSYTAKENLHPGEKTA